MHLGNDTEIEPHCLHFLYHELISTQRGAHSYAVTSEQFKLHTEFFSFMRKGSDALRPIITFDDGQMSDYEIALSILQASDQTARFFITPSLTGKPGYMGWNEIQSLLRAGHAVGAHGWSHNLLTHCDKKQLDTELLRSRRTIEDATGCSVTTMSFPGGRYNHRVLRACREAGYTRVYTSIPRAEPLDLEFIVGRVNVDSGWRVDKLAKVLLHEGHLLGSLRRSYRFKKLMRTTMGDNLYNKLWTFVNMNAPDAEEETSNIA